MNWFVLVFVVLLVLENVQTGWVFEEEDEWPGSWREALRLRRPQMQRPEQAFVDDQRCGPEHDQPGKDDFCARIFSEKPAFHHNTGGLKEKVEHHRTEIFFAANEVERDVNNPFVHEARDKKDEKQRKNRPAWQPGEDGVAKPIAEPQVP